MSEATMTNTTRVKKKQTQIWSTIKTGIIKSYAMWSRIPYFRRGAKNTAKKRAAQPPWENIKKEKHHTLPEGGNSDHIP